MNGKMSLNWDQRREERTPQNQGKIEGWPDSQGTENISSWLTTKGKLRTLLKIILNINLRLTRKKLK